MPWHNTRKTSYWNREKKQSLRFVLAERAKIQQEAKDNTGGSDKTVRYEAETRTQLVKLKPRHSKEENSGAPGPQTARVVPGGNHETEMVCCGSPGFNSITLVNYSLVKENYSALIQRGRKDFSDCQAAITYVRPGQLNHKSQAVQVLGYGRENLTPRHSPVTQPQRLNLPEVSTGGSPGHVLLFRHVDQDHALQGPLLSEENIPLPALPHM